MPSGGRRDGAGRNPVLTAEERILIGSACEAVRDKQGTRRVAALQLQTNPVAAEHAELRQLRRRYPSAAKAARKHVDDPAHPENERVHRQHLPDNQLEAFEQATELIRAIRETLDGMSDNEKEAYRVSMEAAGEAVSFPVPKGRCRIVRDPRPKGQRGKSKRRDVLMIVQRWFSRKTGKTISPTMIGQCWRDNLETMGEEDDIQPDLNNRGIPR